MSDAVDVHSLTGQRLLFVTGRLAEPALREVVQGLSETLGFRYDIAVPGVQVAALLHVNLLLNRLRPANDVDRVILPGLVQGNVQQLSECFRIPFERGPKDLRDLPEYFGRGPRKAAAVDRYSVEIIAEINHATRLPVSEILRTARSLAESGADMIDVGCVPGESSADVAEIVRALRDAGLRVSIDSFDRGEVEQAVEHGAELILSCNSSNVDWVTQLKTEVVAIPNSPNDTNSLNLLVERLQQEQIPFRIDPILEPIGMGFAASLGRYLDFRRRFPDAEMMMGIGNLTELTEVDSAGPNMVLTAFCEELGIRSVLTTQVINWCRTSVAEISVARRLAFHAVINGVIPKHLGASLTMLRDARPLPETDDALQQLAAALTDENFRVFAGDSGLHLMNGRGHWTGSPFDVFADARRSGTDINPDHAFYLGYELARAELCRLLGKRYSQDEPISFGPAGTLPGSASVKSRPPH
ncbi:MAG: dihydropteroate synthase [Planctomycetaceae bacterium]|nr:dihydropteroate synthase [Planctomycetaceae bacterium]